MNENQEVSVNIEVGRGEGEYICMYTLDMNTPKYVAK